MRSEKPQAEGEAIIRRREVPPEMAERIQQDIFARQTWPAYQEMLVSLVFLPFVEEQFADRNCVALISNNGRPCRSRRTVHRSWTLSKARNALFSAVKPDGAHSLSRVTRIGPDASPLLPSGKSTQVPSFILEHEMRLGRDVKIYCTEPRRISAISLAQRVSQELGEAPNACGTRNSYVGYSIRLDSAVSAATRIVYATTVSFTDTLIGTTG